MDTRRILKIAELLNPVVLTAGDDHSPTFGTIIRTRTGNGGKHRRVGAARSVPRKRRASTTVLTKKSWGRKGTRKRENWTGLIRTMERSDERRDMRRTEPTETAETGEGLVERETIEGPERTWVVGVDPRGEEKVFAAEKAKREVENEDLGEKREAPWVGKENKCPREKR